MSRVLVHTSVACDEHDKSSSRVLYQEEVVRWRRWGRANQTSCSNGNSFSDATSSLTSTVLMDVLLPVWLATTSLPRQKNLTRFISKIFVILTRSC